MVLDRIAYDNGILKIINDTSKFRPTKEDPILLREGRLQNFLRKLLFFIYLFIYFYHKIQVILKKQGDHTKANKSGEEAQKETMGLIDIGLRQSKK